MNRWYQILILLWIFPVTLLATHNRAGEITYRHLEGYTYEFTVTTYTYRYSNANRSELTVSWGDGSSSVVPILDPPGHEIIPGTDYFHNIYIGTHTFPGAGEYEILMEDPNRNEGVKNIPNSVNVIFSIRTIMLIGPSSGSNNTPVLLNPPIDKAARGHIFIHNPSAYDPDGDSLSYVITVCTGANGDSIKGYVLPAASDTLLINEVTGDLIWNTPVEIGKYNIAIYVEEWRHGKHIGRIARDMQIDVYDTDDNPPETTPVSDYCVLAGDTISLKFHFTDPDGDPMQQSMFGGPFEVTNPAKFNIDSSDYGNLYSHFEWQTNCSHARKQPYEVVIRTEDITGDIDLSDITSFFIRVLHKAPENLVTLPGIDTIRLEWSVTTCGNAAGYNIYRKLGSGPYTHDSCETGVPVPGYELIDNVTGGNTNYYTDDNHGAGLVPGFDYCYRITAFYNDGAESISSDEACTTLVPGTPPLLKVSVLSDDTINGEIEIAWAVPMDIDTIDDGPYQYEVLCMEPDKTDFTSLGFVPEVPSYSLTDTTFIHTGINTMIFPYTYTVRLLYEEDGIWTQVPGNETATSQYIEIEGSDNSLNLNMKKRSPWLNRQYYIYRQNSEGNFILIDSTTQSEYLDTGLINNREYIYRTIGEGTRPLYGIDYLTSNISHRATGIPVDTIPPCPPDLFVTSECDSLDAYNYLTWDPPADSCVDQDIIAYILYSRDSLYGEFTVLDTLAPNIFSYRDDPENSIEKCYAVAAMDSSHNQSALYPFCVYSICSFYQLPNVFTPNGDGVHDIYVSWNLNDYVKRVRMSIFNRYGKEVFKTENPDIEWDGRYNGKIVTTGVYYYICDVFEPRITGTVIKTLTGFIHVYSGEDNVTVE
jgi:gliding motility-associated-like protein